MEKKSILNINDIRAEAKGKDRALETFLFQTNPEHSCQTKPALGHWGKGNDNICGLWNNSLQCPVWTPTNVAWNDNVVVGITLVSVR